jgi:hypothetical protein
METTVVTFWAPAVWCAVGVPLVFSNFVHYKVRQVKPTSATGAPPRHGMVVLPVLLLFVFSGAACVWWLLDVGTFTKLAYSVVYGAAMTVGLVLVAAHASGDM